MIEPNCDMPWEVYLDWLEDQGYGDLRDMDFNSITGDYHRFTCEYGCGDVGASMGSDFYEHGYGYSMGRVSEGDGCNLGREGYGNGLY